MKDKWHTLTADTCKVCETLIMNGLPKSIIDVFYPQKSLNDIQKAPVHNWYFFTLGYSPLFVQYIIKRNKISRGDTVLDPFVGSGTTLVECKLNGIPSIGIDANDFLTFASRVKTTWSLDINEVKREYKGILRSIEPLISRTIDEYQHSTLDYFKEKDSFLNLRTNNKLVKARYVSPRPLAKLLTLKSTISRIENKEVRELFSLALAAIIVPSSNIRYGPSPGLIKPRTDVNVLQLFKEKMRRIINDLILIRKLDFNVRSDAICGDSRKLRSYTKGEKFDFVITSPPYAGEHEYTRHTRLELALMGFAKDMKDIRIVKQRMIRGSTRNIYVGDKEVEYILKYPEIVDLIERVKSRVKETNGTSGFEKLYNRVVGEYFGGMYLSLLEIFESLEKGGISSFLVGDSHAFKMVHIETARLLGQIGKDIGFSKCEIELWWNKRSTAHNFLLPEYVLHLTK